MLWIEGLSIWIEVRNLWLHCDGVGNGNGRGFGEIVMLVKMEEDYERVSRRHHGF